MLLPPRGRGPQAMAGVVFLLLVRYDYTGIAAPDTSWASGEARNR